MKGKSIVVLTDRAALWRRVSVPLAGAGAELSWVRTAAAAAEAARGRAVDLVLVDPAADAASSPAALRCPVVALAAGDTAGAMAGWQASGAGGLLARLDDDDAVDPDDVLTAVGGVLRRDLFGLEQHLAGFGAELDTRVVTRADERDGVLAALARMAERLRLGARRTRVLTDVADELITNAVYDAPRDRDGELRYLHVDRRDKLVLLPTEFVTVRFGTDGRRFGVSVTDGFGGLGAARVASCLTRGASSGDQIEQKAGGAGIGFYLTLRACDHLAVAIAPGRRTEVTALWQLDRRAPSRGSTFSYLVEGEPAALAPLDDVALVELDGAPTEPLETPAYPAGHPCEEGPEPPDRTDVDADFAEETSRPELAVGWSLDPLAALRGRHLERTAAPPGLDTTIARLRGAASTGQILSSATAYLLGGWRVALALEIDEDFIRTVFTAGDLVDREPVAALELPRLGHSGLAFLAGQGGLMLGPLAAPGVEASLAGALCGGVETEGLAFALSDGEPRYLVFACRAREGAGAAADVRAELERLAHEASEALARVARRRLDGTFAGDSAVRRLDER
jgi:hypothetical protein